MNERLLEDIIADTDKERADSEYIQNRFIDLGREYIAQADDPTTEQVEVLVQHFESRDPDTIDEDSRALMWTMSGILQWMLDDLPLNGETTDPEWLRQQLKIWGRFSE
ncbi:hypothetical protein ACFR9U_13770 [Halorientalis brevis]|uniref:Uncharacterized protein n=1 Tax=Halorientalis brevis TaxID=1126241 RepID=A0ABD6CCH7_9EURY